jgi:hypothetical protein
MDKNTEYTTHAICPHCGYEDKDSWEIGDGGEGDFEVDCGHCDKPFLCSRQVSVYYSTKKVEG